MVLYIDEVADVPAQCPRCGWAGNAQQCVIDRGFSDDGVHKVLCCPSCGHVLFAVADAPHTPNK